jgi:HK97 gp10 family phage protein
MPVSGGPLARLKRIRAAMPRELDKWALEGAEVIASEARRLVDDGGIPSPNHIVSSPGEPPNTDSGNLSSNIGAVNLPDQGKAAAVSNADYGLYLEFGTSNMYERPYMRPATANKRQHVVTLARNAVNRVTK